MSERRCFAEVVHSISQYQCGNKAGHGPAGVYCQEHAKLRAKQRREFIKEHGEIPNAKNKRSKARRA